MIKLLLPAKEKEAERRRRRSTRLSRAQMESRYKVALQPLLHICYLAVTYLFHFITAPSAPGAEPLELERPFSPEEALLALDAISYMEFCHLPSSVPALVVVSCLQAVLRPGSAVVDRRTPAEEADFMRLWAHVPLSLGYCQSHGIQQALGRHTDTEDDVLLNRSQFYLRVLLATLPDAPAEPVFEHLVPLLFQCARSLSPPPPRRPAEFAPFP